MKRGGEQGTGSSNSQSQQQQQHQHRSYVSRSHGGFIPEDVRSSIPLALRRAEDPYFDGDDAETEKGDHDHRQFSARSHQGGVMGDSEGVDVGSGHRSKRSMDEQRSTEVPITWRGGGKNVLLIRAGDDDWKGQQTMVYE